MDITQEEMADRLVMASRTYVDLDHGKTGCSALTLVLFLIYICADPLIFLDDAGCGKDSESGIPKAIKKRPNKGRLPLLGAFVSFGCVALSREDVEERIATPATSVTGS